MGACAIVRTEGASYSGGVTSGSDALAVVVLQGQWMVRGPIAVPGTITAIPDAEGDLPPPPFRILHES